MDPGIFVHSFLSPFLPADNSPLIIQHKKKRRLHKLVHLSSMLPLLMNSRMILTDTPLHRARTGRHLLNLSSHR